MYLHVTRTPRKKQRGRSNRLRAKLRAKNRRRVNRMAGNRLSKRGAS
jgi:hypothetical protein